MPRLRNLALVGAAALAACAAPPAPPSFSQNTAHAGAPQSIERVAPRDVGPMCRSLSEAVFYMGHARDAGEPMEGALAMLRPRSGDSAQMRAAMPHLIAAVTLMWHERTITAAHAAERFFPVCMRVAAR